MNTIDVSYIFNNKVDNKNQPEHLLSPKDILNLTIKNKKNGMTTLSSSSLNFQVASSDVVGNVGDEVTFEVVSSTQSKLELKQINLNNNNITRSRISQKNSKEILEMFKNNNVLHETDKYSADEKELRDMKAQEVIRKIQNQLKYATNNASDSAIKELIANGINLNKITLDILTSVMSEIDSRPIKEVSSNELIKITNSYIEENNISTDFFESKASVIKAVKNSGLPTTKNNIELIESTLAKVDKIQEATDFTSFITNDLEPTIENLYALSFSTISDTPEAVAEFNNARDLYKNLADELNLTFDTDTENLFKDFIKNNIDITLENIEKYNLVKDKILNLDKYTLTTELIEKIKTGEKILDTNLLEVTKKELYLNKEEILNSNIDTVNTLNKVTNENINFFIRNFKVLNVHNLKEVIKENKTLPVIQETPENIEQKKSVLQLMEKLTYDVAYRLAKTGINIDTLTISSAVDEIKKVEMATFSQALKQFDVANTENNLSTMSTTFEQIGKLPPFNSTVYNDIITDKIRFNITEVAKAVDASRAIEGYEIFETQVSGKWNDSFSKISEQILPFLEKLGLPASDKNFRSAEILIKNHMDITLENIENIKEIDLKIDKLQETLHPRIVSKLLSDGLNPLTMDIDSILESIDEYNNFYGDDVKDKIASYLLEVQKSGDLSDETLKAVKSIYKALNIIQKNNGASIGSLYNANHSLTIGNLLDSSKYFSETKNNRSKIDTVVGDEHITSIENSDSIKNSIEQSIATSYEKLLLEKLSAEATPEGLSKFIENNVNYKEHVIENVIDILKDINKNISNNNIDENKIKIAMEKLENALSNTGVSINFLSENNIPLTIENLFHFKEMIDNPFDISKKLRKALDDDSTLKTKFKELSEGDLKTNASQGALIDITIGDIEDYEPTTLDLTTNKTDMLSQLDLYSALTKSPNNNFTQIPIKLPLSEDVTTLNMYVVNEDYQTKEVQKIGFSLDTDVLGSVEALVTFHSNSISATITSNNTTTSFLEKSKEELSDYFKELGYENIEITFDNKDLKSFITNDFI